MGAAFFRGPSAGSAVERRRHDLRAMAWSSNKLLPLALEARIDFTDGARRPGSPSSVGAAPGTAFAYDQRIDKFNHIIFAGQVSYDEDSPAGGIAAVWLPTGSAETGPESTIVLREAKLGPNGPTFRGVRLDQGGTFALGDRFILRVGGEYVLVGAGSIRVEPAAPHEA